MQSWSVLRERLGHVVEQATTPGRELDASSRAWLDDLSPRDLVRAQRVARRYDHQSTPFPPARSWDERRVRTDAAVAALAALHPDGRFRETGVRSLTVLPDAIATRVLALTGHDHVEVIRELATDALIVRTSPSEAQHAVPVLLALSETSIGRRGLLGRYVGACASVPGGARVQDLACSDDRDTRAWVYRHRIEAPDRDVSELCGWLQSEVDQVCRAILARALVDIAPHDVSWLATSSRVDDRVTGLWYLPDENVSLDFVEARIFDRSARIRQAARWRYRRSGRDVEAHILAGLDTVDPTARELPYVLAAAREVGLGISADRAAALLRDERPSVRAEAVRGWPAPGASALVLLGLLEDVSPTVARLAVEQLVGHSLTYASLDRAAGSDSVVARRAALACRRSLGDWSRVRADLDVLAEPELRTEGVADLDGWLRDRSAQAYSVPTGEDRVEILRLLESAGLPGHMESRLRFCIGR